MEGKIPHILFTLIRSTIRGIPMTDEEKAQFSEEMVQDLMMLAKKHDLAHLAGYGVYKNELLDKSSPYYPKIQQAQIMAVFRYEKLNYEFERLCEALEKAEIPFIPLKGSVLRRYYPEPWMRTSCDIDVLVHEEDVDRAACVLSEECGYDRKNLTSHDISLYSQDGQHIELHYALVEDGRANSAPDILREIWHCTVVRRGKHFWNELTDEMFYFYHIAHMAKHFTNGGCGIRPFIDLWILDRIRTADHTARNALLQKGNLLQFTEVARNLNRCWMEDAVHDSMTQQMENFILFGGVYGNTQNRIIIQQQKKGGRLAYIYSRLILPYDSLKTLYPILLKHRWLLPLMQVRRWFKLLKPDVANRAKQELAVNNGIDQSKAHEMKCFLNNIGL